MKYLYSVTGYQFLCSIPFPLSMQEQTNDFVRLLSEKEALELQPDISVIFTETDTIPDTWKKSRPMMRRYYASDGRTVFFTSTPPKPPYAYIVWNDEYTVADIRYLPNAVEYLNYSHNLCDVLGIESFLLHHTGLLLHSSFIRTKKGEGILFSAPSGTGKSTQADLWERYRGAEILNGDRAGIRLTSNGWTAHGLPYAGTSGIYKNASAPIKAIIMLEQAPLNEIKLLTPAQAFRRLYPEISILRYDTNLVTIAISTLERLISDIPVYLLRCLPDEEAVSCAEAVLY